MTRRTPKDRDERDRDDPVWPPTGAGGDPFDTFFRDFDREFQREFDRIRGMMGDIMQNAMRSMEDMKPGQPYVYGFTMRMGPDGRPRIENFGNLHPLDPLGQAGGAGADAGEGATVPGREPLTDVFEGDQEISVTVELPGVAKEDINLHVGHREVTIRVDQGPEGRRYFKRVELPGKVVPKTAEATYKNGVLDLTIQRAADDEGERVPVK